jgi:trk system potassium uptake protein TrkH
MKVWNTLQHPSCLTSAVIPAFFILGELGFIVVGDVYRTPNWRKLTLHSKLMLVGTAVFIT